MSEQKRNDAASGKDASKDKTTASAAKSEQASASSGAKPASGKASAPATDPKATEPNTSKTSKPAQPSSGSGKADTHAATGKPGASSAAKSSSPSAGKSASSSVSSGSSAPTGQSASPPRAGANTSTTPPRSASGGSAGGTPNRSAPATGSGGNGGATRIIAIAAVLVALVAIAMSGWVLYRGQGQLGTVDSRLDTVEKSLQSNVQDVIMPRIKRLDSRLQSLAGDVEQQSKTLSSVQESVKQTQSRSAELANQLTGNRNRWQLNQIESLLQAANQRLQLYNDPEGARTALELANDAIGRKGDPRLFKLRGEIVNEIAALDALPDPDVEGMSLALSAMAEQVPDLPLASNVPAAYDNADDSGQQSGDQPGDDSGMSMDQFQAQFSQGWDHFVGSLGDALSGMLTIRRSDGTQRALLPPDQAFFLSQNLQLELRSARLALLERDTQNYRDSLASAGQWLENYYDTSAAPVSKMQERIGQMSNVKLDWDAPDISASLIQLRQMMSERAGASNNDSAENAGGDANKNAGNDAGEDSQ